MLHYIIALLLVSLPSKDLCRYLPRRGLVAVEGFIMRVWIAPLVTLVSCLASLNYLQLNPIYLNLSYTTSHIYIIIILNNGETICYPYHIEVLRFNGIVRNDCDDTVPLILTLSEYYTFHIWCWRLLIDDIRTSERVPAADNCQSW